MIENIFNKFSSDNLTAGVPRALMAMLIVLENGKIF